MRTDDGHLARLADRELLADITDAAAWWAGQRTWRVSSSHTGGGVIAAFEDAVARGVGQHARALALPNATIALTTALRAVGISPGSTIGVPALDWTTTAAVARSLGIATSALPVTSETGLLDVAELGRSPERLTGLAAIIAVHLHGLSCDIPTLRRAGIAIPVIEDAAQAWGSSYPDRQPVGSAADACVFSFGSTKRPSAGELGCLVTRAADLHRRAVALTQHPTRQLLSGIRCPRQDQPMTRVAPAAALLGAYAIKCHTALAPGLRGAAARVEGKLRALGLDVLTDPAVHAPGVIAIRAAPEDIRAALRSMAVGSDIAVESVDTADVRAHPDLIGDQTLGNLASAITVVTIKPARIE